MPACRGAPNARACWRSQRLVGVVEEFCRELLDALVELLPRGRGEIELIPPLTHQTELLGARERIAESVERFGQPVGLAGAGEDRGLDLADLRRPATRLQPEMVDFRERAISAERIGAAGHVAGPWGARWEGSGVGAGAGRGTGEGAGAVPSIATTMACLSCSIAACSAFACIGPHPGLSPLRYTVRPPVAGPTLTVTWTG
jgi:hypothetical protein